MIRRCNITIYYGLTIYSNINDKLFGQKGVHGAWNDYVDIWVEKSFSGQA